jgi:hypothetical protein
MNIFITLLENVNKSRTNAGSLSLTSRCSIFHAQKYLLFFLSDRRNTNIEQSLEQQAKRIREEKIPDVFSPRYAGYSTILNFILQSDFKLKYLYSSSTDIELLT